MAWWPPPHPPWPSPSSIVPGASAASSSGGGRPIHTPARAKKGRCIHPCHHKEEEEGGGGTIIGTQEFLLASISFGAGQMPRGGHHECGCHPPPQSGEDLRPPPPPFFFCVFSESIASRHTLFLSTALLLFASPFRTPLRPYHHPPPTEDAPLRPARKRSGMAKCPSCGGLLALASTSAGEPLSHYDRRPFP